MTIRQLSNAAGCDISTVKRIGKMMYPSSKSIGRGIALDYNRTESVNIMAKLPKKNFINDPNIGQMPQVNIGQMPQAETPIKLEGFDMLAFSQIIAKTMSAAMAQILNRLDAIEENNINGLPLISAADHHQKGEEKFLPAPKKSDRNALRQLINKYTKDKLDGDYREAWNNLYEELYYRESVNIRTRAKNLNITKLDCIESLNLIESSIAIIMELMN